MIAAIGFKARFAPMTSMAERPTWSSPPMWPRCARPRSNLATSWWPTTSPPPKRQERALQSKRPGGEPDRVGLVEGRAGHAAREAEVRR
jgi:hypothetical protein